MSARRYSPLLLSAGLLLAAACGESSTTSPGGSAADAAAGTGGASGPGRTADGATDPGAPVAAQIALRVSTPSQPARSLRAELRPGAAWGDGLHSLAYLIRSIAVCESLDASGSGFRNPSGCLSLYDGDPNALPYDPMGDLTPLGDAARTRSEGFVDLLDPAARERLSSARTLGASDAHAYHYGLVTWALPIKVRASVRLNDGSTLYTHDGVSRSEVVGVDHFRNYFTAPSTPLDQAPAEPAVVLLPNGGNWFKFQSPLVISADDIAAGRGIVLDLVFNPDGIVKGFAGDQASGALREDSDAGRPARAISVPMLDLAPVPHRDDEYVVRESYQGALSVGADHFDVRIELYGVEGDPNAVIYGVDLKSLVNADTTSVPPELSKASYLERGPDGAITLSSWAQRPIVSGLTRAARVGDVVSAQLACGMHGDRARAEGGAAFVVASCPADTVSVQLTLTARGRLAGGGAPDAGLVGSDAGEPDAGDAGEPDAGDAGALDAGVPDAGIPDAG